VEPVEGLRGVRRRHARARVGNLDQHPALDRAEPHRDLRRGRRMRPDVAEQVSEHLADLALVDDADQPRRGLSADGAIRLNRHRVGDRVAHHDREVCLREIEGGRPVQPRQLEPVDRAATLRPAARSRLADAMHAWNLALTAGAPAQGWPPEEVAYPKAPDAAAAPWPLP
jgi:hypothetical protein